MKIDGRAISSNILESLKPRVEKLKAKGITPTLAIILVGDNEASNIYVKQKGIKAEEIGAEVKVFHTNEKTTNEDLEKTISKLSFDSGIHGIIIQRPAPSTIDADRLNELIPSIKEVDGFGRKSIYPVPVAQAVWKMLDWVHKDMKEPTDFIDWLNSEGVVIIGKGETAGAPIIDLFEQNGIVPRVVTSKTKNPDKIFKNADILISAVGKSILKAFQIKKGAVLIGVGLYSDENGKLRGDYDNKDVENVASFFSPTPGGVGPVNVASLMENLVSAAEKIQKD